MIINENSIVQHVIQIKNVNVSVNIIISAKMTITVILAHVFVRIESI